VSEPPRELARKGRRVAGMFLLLIGAGVVLESNASWSGAALMLLGLGVHLSGFMAQSSPDVLAREAREET